MLGAENGEEVLGPIPMNFVDIALAKVKHDAAVQSNPPAVTQNQNNPIPSKNTATGSRSSDVTEQPTTYFKDPLGNEYRMKNGCLYMKGWNDVTAKIRIISEKTGKEVPMNGKKVQIYGWTPIKTVEDSDLKSDDAAELEDTDNG